MISRSIREPIAALASGHGAIAVIRICGDDVFETIAPALNVSFLAPRIATLTNILSCDGAVIDQAVALAFKGPASFTGQDTVEIMCHGGPYIVQTILERLFDLGVRPAEPGEFTKRAYLNGKIDLTAAEGIRDLVEAQSRQQWLAGQQLLSGALGQHVDALRSELIEAMAYLEAMIDFPDEGDTAHLRYDHVRPRVAKVDARLRQLAQSYRGGHVASQGLQVALFGPPNAGKSTLMNTLLNRTRAIVSATPGTTRDYIEERCLIEGRLIRLIDMAGIRDSDDDIEQEGIKLARSLAQQADLLVVLVPTDSDDATIQRLMRESAQFPSRMIVQTKIDLPAVVNVTPDIKISCATGEGLESFKKSLVKLVDEQLGNLSSEPFLTSMRQKHAVDSAVTAMAKFWNAIDHQFPQELVAFELQQAAGALKSLTGEISSDDLLGKIFSEFCIGK